MSASLSGWDLPSEAHTAAFGRLLATHVQGGDVIGLQGPLGAGKTRLAQAFAAGLGVVDEVTSPTFVLVRRYQGRFPLFHLDAYRLHDLDEFAELGPEEFFEPPHVTLIEWSDRVAASLPAERLELTLDPVDVHARELRLSGHGRRGAELVAQLSAAWPAAAAAVLCDP
jgi:tRNA threonylcarbamoyladenosine biosynthesis protein TsaE